MEEFKILSKRLYELRTLEGLTQQDVALHLKISYQSYQAYERGIAVPSLKNFIKLADFFDVSLDYLVGKKDY